MYNVHCTIYNDISAIFTGRVNKELMNSAELYIMDFIRRQFVSIP